VQTVTVLSVSDCSGLTNLASMDPAASASLAADQKVTDAIKAAGYEGQQVVAYSTDGASLTVYVKQN